MSTFEDAVVDNIAYEENRQPDEVVCSHLCDFSRHFVLTDKGSKCYTH